MDYFEHPEQNINDFDVFEILGRGGFARVYRAVSKITGQEVAIKIIDKKMAQENKMIDRVSKEVELHHRLKHPAILELYGFFEDSKYVYIVLELCHNGNLYRKVQENGSLSEDTARKYMKQIISGLKYLHTYNILHRDLTLANILLTKDDKVKISDFGLATELRHDESHYTMCGTPNYISPEIVSRQRSQSLESDVWSIGCILYTMLFGKAPFDTKEVRGTLCKVLTGQFDLSVNDRKLSESAQNLIIGILQTHPEKRFTLAQIINHPFMQHNMVQQVSGNKLMKQISQKTHDVSTADSGIASINSHEGKRSITTCDAAASTISYFQTTPLHTASPHTNHHSLPHPIMHIHPTLNISNSSPALQSNNSCCSNFPQSTQFTSSSSPPLPPPLSISHTVLPLITTRLKSIRQKTRNTILNILDDQSVCLEFLKYTLASSNKEVVKITEIMCIDASGINILVYHPNCAYNDSLDKPVPMESGNKVRHFLLSNIPSKYIKKYDMAKKFVDVVRSRTAKITIYSPKSKFQMMENQPNANFEMTILPFKLPNNSDTCNLLDKINFIGQSQSLICHFKDGTNLSIDSNNSSKLSASLTQMIQYFHKSKEYCQSIEHHMNQLSPPDNKTNSYPIIIGRPSTNDQAYSENRLYSGLVSPQNLPPSILDKFSTNSSLSTISTPQSSVQHSSIFIPNIGWATQQSNNGQLSILFNDGSQMIIQYNSSNINHIKWLPSFASGWQHFTKHDNDKWPQELHSKIELLPEIVKHIRCRTLKLN